VDCAVRRRRHRDPHIGVVYLLSRSEYAIGGEGLRLGATLTTLYLQFEKEAEAALGIPPGFHSYALLPIALLPIGYPMDRFVASRSPMSSSKIGGASLAGISSGSKCPVSSAKRLPDRRTLSAAPQNSTDPVRVYRMNPSMGDVYKGSRRVNASLTCASGEPRIAGQIA